MQAIEQISQEKVEHYLIAIARSPEGQDKSIQDDCVGYQEWGFKRSRDRPSGTIEIYLI